MRVKVLVWEPKKADPSRVDRAETLDELIHVLDKLNYDDEFKIYVTGLKTEICIKPLLVKKNEPGLYEQMYHILREFVDEFIPIDQKEIINEKLIKCAAENDRE